MILDRIEEQIRQHVYFDLDQKYVAITLWITGTRFLTDPDLKVFDAFPMLAFMSPEPDSGKSRALKVTELLSHNALSAGRYTPAALLAKIDQSNGGMLTICLDEIDTIFRHGTDNADLIQLFNLGYERGAVMSRCARFKDGATRDTPAYCPKAFAGLKIARIPEPTKTRTVIVNMRPKTDGQVNEHIDTQKLTELNSDIDAWAKLPSTVQALKGAELPDTSFLNNRNRQIWKPLLAVAKGDSAAWYQRGLEAARFFTSDRPGEKNLSHRILLATYRIFRSGLHLDKIHTADLLNGIYDLGIPTWVDAGRLREYLSAYDEQIRPRQIKIKENNRNGYDWHTFLDAFRTYINPAEVQSVEQELGIGPITQSTW